MKYDVSFINDYQKNKKRNSKEIYRGKEFRDIFEKECKAFNRIDIIPRCTKFYFPEFGRWFIEVRRNSIVELVGTTKREEKCNEIAVRLRNQIDKYHDQNKRRQLGRQEKEKETTCYSDKRTANVMQQKLAFLKLAVKNAGLS